MKYILKQSILIKQSTYFKILFFYFHQFNRITMTDMLSN